MNDKFELGLISQKLKRYSEGRLNYPKDNFVQPDKRNSAVLIPLVVIKNELGLLFTVRSSNLERHSGQVSFPGGLIESGDNTPIEAALRETEEEIGIGHGNIQILGELTPLNSTTGYIIYPFVGFVEMLHHVRSNAAEVERVFCIPLSWLSDNRNAMLKDYPSFDGAIHKVWYFNEFEGELLWGITATLTKNFLDIIKK